MTGTIFDIKEMAVHDGPGIRTTVFLKGCPLRCIWCHNPEGLISKPQLMFKEVSCIGCNSCKVSCSHPECQQFDRCIHRCPNNCLEISGKIVSAEILAKELIKSAEILGTSFGGFTFSGGEPLAQPEFLFDLMENLKGFHLCIETSGFCNSDIFEKALSYLDFVIMDIKLADERLHQKYTGVSNELILKNFEILKASGKPYLVRTPMVPGITDSHENISKIKEIIGESDWENLPYNALAGAKYKMLGMEFKI